MSDFKEIEQLAETMKAEKEAPMAERPTPERLAELRRMVATAWDGNYCPADLDELVAEVDALTARAVAAEQERDEQRQRAEEAEYGCEVLSVGDPYERLRDVREAGKTALRERDEARAKLVAAEQDASDTRNDLIEALEHMTSIAATLSLPGTVTGDRLVEEVRRLHAAATATGEHYSWINHGIRAEKERDEAHAKLVAAEQRVKDAELALEELRRRAWLHLEYAGGYTDHVSREGLRTALRDEPTDLAEALRRELRAEGMEMGADLLSARSETEGRHEVINAPVSRGVYSIDLANSAALLRQRAAELRGPK